MRYMALHWRHNERDGASNHQPHDCLLNRLFRCRSKKTSKLRVTGLCAGNSPVTGEFPAQMASNAENVSIWWRHHGDSQKWNLVKIARRRHWNWRYWKERKMCVQSRQIVNIYRVLFCALANFLCQRKFLCPRNRFISVFKCNVALTALALTYRHTQNTVFGLTHWRLEVYICNRKLCQCWFIIYRLVAGLMTQTVATERASRLRMYFCGYIYIIQ